MPLSALKIPPGQFGNGTPYQAKGRWADGSLVRWFNGTLQPMGGWDELGLGQVQGMARSITTWSDFQGTPWIAVGTHLALYAFDGAGNIHDIRLYGVAQGQPDATDVGGYGAGLYGADEYGTARPSDGSVQPATVYSLSVRGQRLYSTNGVDGRIAYWDSDTANDSAVLTGAPTGVRALVVTDEGFVMALGVDGDPRTVAWSDQVDDEDWTPDPGVNQAGSYALDTSGTLMCGKRISGGTLIFTDSDVHLATYIDATVQYGFRRIADDGAISQGAAVNTSSTRVIWWGNEGFYAYEGYTQRIPCDVADAVFNDFNTLQRSKVTAFHDPKFGEVTWFYPTENSSENNAYVRYNYIEGHWARGLLARTCAVGRGGAFTHPLMVDTGGRLLKHEFGFDHEDAAIYAVMGPQELGSGDQIMHVLNIVADEQDLGTVSRTIYMAQSPTGSETTFGPYTSTNPINTRASGRQFRMRIDFDEGADGRYGIDRLDIRGGGRRL